MTEIQLLDRAGKGDREALGELLCMYQSRVFSAALAITGNREEALDLAQEAYIVVCRKVSQCHSAFLPWTMAILRNLFISRLRSKKTREIPVPSEDLAHFPDSTLSTEEIIELKITGDAVKEVLTTLPEEYRWVLMLRHLQDFSISEIAETLGLKEGTVKSQLHRGRLLLLKRLARGGKGGKILGLQ